jgi:dihydroneopterin aldolase
MDIVFIRELRLDAWVGIYKYEKAARQAIEFDIEIALPGNAVFASHKVRDTVNYAEVVERIRALLANEHFGLVEVLAERVAMLLLDEFHTPRVKVSVTKLGVLREAKRVGACVERTRA